MKKRRRPGHGEREITAMAEALQRGEAVDVSPPPGAGQRQRDLAAQRSTWLAEARRRVAPLLLLALSLLCACPAPPAPADGGDALAQVDMAEPPPCPGSKRCGQDFDCLSLPTQTCVGGCCVSPFTSPTGAR